MNSLHILNLYASKRFYVISYTSKNRFYYIN